MRSMIINAQLDNQCAALICRRKTEKRTANEKGSGRERLLPLLHYLLRIAALLVLFQKKSAAYARLSAEISERISNQFFFRTEIINAA